MVGSEVRLIEYSKRVDASNCITHAAGAILSAAALIFMIIRTNGIGLRHTFSAVIFGLSMIAVYTVSAVYHGLPSGEAKRIARLVDHSTVPVLIAGTATPCALITLYDVSAFHCFTVLIIAWFCAIFGMISKLFFFEKLKAVTMAVYIGSCAVMLFSVVPILGEINGKAFAGILLGCLAYLIGAVLCFLGIKKEVFHVVFHIFVMIGNAIHLFIFAKYML